MTIDFKTRCHLKKALNNRLKSDGYWDAYNKLRDFLKRNGVSESIAWRVAAYQFPPKDGSTPEIVGDELYAEIAAGWGNGSYPIPDANPQPAEATRDAAVDKVPNAEAWKADWERLAVEVGSRSASELEEIRWVVANYLTPVKQLNSDEVPSSAALSILSWVKASASNFGDFLRSSYVKILPDKRELEHLNRFVDDGRDLDRLAEFMRREQEYYPNQLIAITDQSDREVSAHAEFTH